MMFRVLCSKLKKLRTLNFEPLDAWQGEGMSGKAGGVVS